MKKIFIVNTTLSTGGIATSLVNLLNKIDYSLYSVDLLILQENSDARYKVNSNVNILNVDSSQFLFITHGRKEFNNLPVREKIKWIYQKIRFHINKEDYSKKTFEKVNIMGEYDYSISFRNDSFINGKSQIACCEDIVKYSINSKEKIAWIHNDPDRHGITHDVALRRYEKFDKIVNVSLGCKNRFDEIIPEYIHKSHYIYNTFPVNEILEKSTSDEPLSSENGFIYKFLTVCRIDNEQKRVDRVVKVAKMLVNSGYKNFKWYIVGDGPDMKVIENMISQYNLSNYVILTGKKENPYSYMKCADLFVMTSDYEAFPMVLNEVIICKTPIITTNHISAKEIVTDKIGWVVDCNSIAIYTQIKEILFNPIMLSDKKKQLDANIYNDNLSMNQFYTLLGNYENEK